MNELRHAVGELIRLQASFSTFSLAPVARIRRQFDGRYFDGSIVPPGNPWVTSPADNPMAELNTADLPGIYFYDFPQARDPLGVSDYTVRMRSTHTTEVEDLILRVGPLISAPALAMCTVFGVIRDPGGRPQPNVAVRGTVIPVAFVPFATGISLLEVDAVTDEQGAFQMSLAQGLRVRLEITAIGYDKRVLIPPAPSVDFTTL